MVASPPGKRNCEHQVTKQWAGSMDTNGTVKRGFKEINGKYRLIFYSFCFIMEAKDFDGVLCKCLRLRNRLYFIRATKRTV